MKFVKYSAKIALILFATGGMAEEEIASAPSPSIANEELSIPYSGRQFPPVRTNKKILYGSASIAPGAGLSVRARDGLKGTAMDYKIGVLPFIFESKHLIPVLSFDYNYLYYSKDDDTSPYLSYGLGAANFLPYVPLRAGIEFRHGFIEIGAKMLVGVVPFPEIRAGVHLKF